MQVNVSGVGRPASRVSEKCHAADGGGGIPDIGSGVSQVPPAFGIRAISQRNSVQGAEGLATLHGSDAVKIPASQNGFRPSREVGRCGKTPDFAKYKPLTAVIGGVSPLLRSQFIVNLCEGRCGLNAGKAGRRQGSITEITKLDEALTRAEYFAVRVDHVAPCVGCRKRQGVSLQVQSARIQRSLQSIVGGVPIVGDLRDVTAVRIKARVVTIGRENTWKIGASPGSQAARVISGRKGIHIGALIESGPLRPDVIDFNHHFARELPLDAHGPGLNVGSGKVRRDRILRRAVDQGNWQAVNRL